MNRRVVTAVLPATVTAAVLVGCSGPSDTDGEPVPAGHLVAVPVATQAAVPVVVDTDLGADDLLALAYLLRHPGVEVRAVTVATTGLAYYCAPAVDVVADLLTALGEPAVPVACGGPATGERARPFPTAWRMSAIYGSGLPRDAGTLPVDPHPAADLLAAAADSAGASLRLIALGPLTNVAQLAADHPESYALLAGVHAMAGIVEGPGEDGVGEWNAAADPEALDAVLAGAVPVTIVPADAVPPGTPDGLRAPVVGHVVMSSEVDTWWDLAAAVAFTEPSAVTGCEAGTWMQSEDEAGRLVRSGPAGTVCVVRQLERAVLDAASAGVFRVSR